MADEMPTPDNADTPVTGDEDRAASRPDDVVEPSMDAAADEALRRADEAAARLEAEVEAGTTPRAPDLPELAPIRPADVEAGLGMLGDVDLHVKVELGRTRMYVEDILRLSENSVVELDRTAGDPVDIYVNDRRVARGEVLVLGENFCVRVSEILEPAAMEDPEAA